MSNLAQIKKIEYIPQSYYDIPEVEIQNAIELASLAEIHLQMDAERRALLVLNIESKSQKLKHYELNPRTAYMEELKMYMEVYLGFRFDKYDGFEKLLNDQILTVLKLVGELYPSLGRLEVFSAIKYCIKHKPEMVKPYDTKDTLSSFTGVYLSHIVRVYMEYKNIASNSIKDLLRQLPKSPNNKQSILQKIRTHRDVSCMVLQNIAKYLHGGSFVMPDGYCINGKTYVGILYDNMVYLGLLKEVLPGEDHPYKNEWNQWKDKKDANENNLTAFEKVNGCQRQIILEAIKTLCPVEMIETNNEWIEDYQKGLLSLAQSLGFLGDVPEIDYTQDFELSQLIEKYGKQIVNIFPLEDWEFRVNPKISEGVGSRLRDTLNNFTAK